MQTVEDKCALRARTYEVAGALAEAGSRREIYSSLAISTHSREFYLERRNIGHFVSQKVQVIPGIVDARSSPSRRSDMRADRFRLMKADDGVRYSCIWLPDGGDPEAVDARSRTELAEQQGRYDRSPALTGAATPSRITTIAPRARPDEARRIFGAAREGWAKYLGDLWSLNRRIATDLPNGQPIVQRTFDGLVHGPAIPPPTFGRWREYILSSSTARRRSPATG